MTTYAVLGIFYFFYVFARAFQQRNVAFGNYAWVMPFSFAMATIDVFVVATVARTGFAWGIVLAMAVGGGAGAMAAMNIHERWFRK